MRGSLVVFDVMILFLRPLWYPFSLDPNQDFLHVVGSSFKATLLAKCVRMHKQHLCGSG